MSDEEKELINNIERALNLSEVKGDLVTIIYNYIVKATINLINKLQKELDKKDKVINLMINWIDNRCFYSDDYVNSCEIIQDSCFNPIKDCEKCIKEYFYKKVEEENE